eukprot:421615_1
MNVALTEVQLNIFKEFVDFQQLIYGLKMGDKLMELNNLLKGLEYWEMIDVGLDNFIREEEVTDWQHQSEEYLEAKMDMDQQLTEQQMLILLNIYVFPNIRNYFTEKKKPFPLQFVTNDIMKYFRNKKLNGAEINQVGFHKFVTNLHKYLMDQNKDMPFLPLQMIYYYLSNPAEHILAYLIDHTKKFKESNVSTNTDKIFIDDLKMLKLLLEVDKLKDMFIGFESFGKWKNEWIYKTNLNYLSKK